MSYELTVGDVVNTLKLIALIAKNPSAKNIKMREETMKDFMREHQKELKLTDKEIEEYDSTADNSKLLHRG